MRSKPVMAMNNPWEEISLDDYESHMSLESVRQLQMLDELMKEQFGSYPVGTAMILGVAGGNGLEHIDTEKYSRVYGADINADYLKATQKRFPQLSGVLECLQADLINEYEKLPAAELVIADLLVEYIGYEAFQKVVMQVKPKYVSCVIQINTDTDNWVSDSPYLHAFDRLDEVHHQMSETGLINAMQQIGYSEILDSCRALPNGKTLVRLDFIYSETTG